MENNEEEDTTPYNNEYGFYFPFNWPIKESQSQEPQGQEPAKEGQEPEPHKIPRKAKIVWKYKSNRRSYRYNYAWINARKRHLYAFPLCQVCGCLANEVHHISGNHNDHKADNLMSLCSVCHRKIHGKSR